MRVVVVVVVNFKFTRAVVKAWRIFTLAIIPEFHRITAMSIQGD